MDVELGHLGSTTASGSDTFRHARLGRGPRQTDDTQEMIFMMFDLIFIYTLALNWHLIVYKWL